MKAPLRVATKEAEKLRHWLASELEPHEILNIDQYAHHVVTIFLNDDLDIEDEPLSPVGDFLSDIYSLRCGKSLERKKRAAVQFLNSVISCDKTVDTGIEGIINELIVRIEATKSSKSSRKLLGSLTLNVTPSNCKQSSKRNKQDQERRYNEAFPSLSGVSVRGSYVSLISGRKENKAPFSAARTIQFTDKNEADACLTASLVFSLAIPDEHFPSPETMEIPSSSAIESSQNVFEGEWKSAFSSVNPTKLYRPNTNVLSSPEATVSPAVRPIVVVGSTFSNEYPSYRTLQHYVDLFHPHAEKIFLHPEKLDECNRIAPDMVFARDAIDLEVANTIAWSEICKEQHRRYQRSGIIKKKGQKVTKTKQVEGNRTEPKDLSLHHQGYVGDPKIHPPQELPNGIQAVGSPLLGAVGGVDYVDGDGCRVPDLICVDSNCKTCRSRHTSGGADLIAQYQEQQIIMDKKVEAARAVDEIEASVFNNGFDLAHRQGRPDHEPPGPTGEFLNAFGCWPDQCWGQGSGHEVYGATGGGQSYFRRTPGLKSSCGGANGGSESTGSQGGYGSAVSRPEPNRMDASAMGAMGPWNSFASGMFQRVPIFQSDNSSPYTAAPNIEHVNNMLPVLQLSPLLLTNGLWSQQEPAGPFPGSGTASNNGTVYPPNEGVSNYPWNSAHVYPAVYPFLSCNDLEQDWLARQSLGNSQDVVKGNTCSSWLEGYCSLGDDCPFSHPRI